MQTTVSTPFPSGVQLVRELKESGADFCIGGACYPEVYPESTNQSEDTRYLKENVDEEITASSMFLLYYVESA